MDLNHLRKTYEEDLSDEALLDMALTDPDDYQEGVYDLILEAVNKRGLNDKLEVNKHNSDKELEGSYSSDDLNWIEIYQYNDEIKKLELEVFFKELSIIYRDLPSTNSFGEPTGIGTIIVREDYIEQASTIIADFEGDEEFSQNFMDDNLIKEAIINVLKKRNVSDFVSIANEIIEEINNNTELTT